MTPFLIALAAVQAAVPGPAGPPRGAPAAATAPAECVVLLKRDANAALDMAGRWLVRGGGASARQCQGLAYAALERWPAAATAFEQAAVEAETAQDPRRADFWAQAGNAWLAAGDPAKARRALDSALASPTLAAELRGEVHLDRARAAVAANDLGAARADIDKGLELVPADPFGWYLSSALALKEGRLARAQDDIAEAVRLAPGDPDLLLHAGNVAGMSGEEGAARGLYAKAIKAAPDSAAARAARTALAANR